MLNSSDIRFSFGHNCKDSSTPLTNLPLIEIFEKVLSPDERDLIDLTKNLRSILRYSKERYRSMKTRLPFFSCSVFEPAHRSIQNFKHAHGLVIDIDYHNVVPEEMIVKFKNDPRIAMGYVSPSNKGIKLIFYFDRPIDNPSLYTYLYKKFSVSFGQQYHLADCIDPKNSDVSRISFLCHDAHAWFQNDAVALDTEPYVKDYVVSEAPIEEQDNGLTPTAYKQILNLLDTRPKVAKTELPLVKEISEILPEIREALESYGIQLKNTESIQYGAKIRVVKDKDQGELNVYYGRQGYKVVTSPRKGTHYELNEVTKQIVEGVVVGY